MYHLLGPIGLLHDHWDDLMHAGTDCATDQRNAYNHNTYLFYMLLLALFFLNQTYKKNQTIWVHF